MWDKQAAPAEEVLGLASSQGKYLARTKAMPATVLIISAADPQVFGGQEKQTLELIKGLKDNYRFLVVAEKGRFSETASGVADIFERALRRRDIRRSIAEVKDIIAAQEVDIVHTLELRGNLIGRMAVRSSVRRRRPKVVATRHEFVYSPFFSARKRLTRLAYGAVERFTQGYCDRYIAVSQALKQELVAKLKVSEDKVTVIPNGVPESAGRSTTEKQPVVGYIGRLIPEKGLDDLIEAARMVLDDWPAARFVVVGEGPYLPHIRKRLNDLGLGQAFEIVGQVHDVEAQIDRFMFLVLPSKHEGFPMVVLEAMRLGVPVIGTKVGGIPEIIRDGRNGFLVEAGRPEELARAILELLQDERRREAMGCQAEKTAEDFAAGKMTARTQAVYEELFRAEVKPVAHRL
jgi:glycosyltransferase involved in cell wall biosynthesis